MVSNARDDLPEPDSPVITTNLSLGISMQMPLRLCSLAPLILIKFFEFTVLFFAGIFFLV